MRILFTILAVALTSTMTFAQSIDDATGFIKFNSDTQFEISAGRTGVAITDGVDSISNGAWHVGAGYDFADGDFRIAPEVDVYIFDGGAGTSVIPGLSIGHNNIYAITSYDTSDELFYVGVGGRINLGENVGVNLTYQQSNLGKYGLPEVAVGVLQVGLTIGF